MTTGVCRNCGGGKVHASGLCNKCYAYNRKHGIMRPLDVKRGGKRRGDYTGTTCTNCGVGGRLRLGLCSNCYRYAYNHGGAMRPLDSSLLARRRKHTHCTNCGAQKHHGHGMCRACYEYWRFHGKMRPPEGIRRPAHDVIRMCRQCKENIADCGNLCSTCADYKYRTGKSRPRRLWSKNCLNCGKPHIDSQPRSGLCAKCLRYQRERGNPRPAYLWGKGTHGWCECGAAAEHIITVKIHNHVDKIAVCDACYAEEMRMSAVYGGVSAQKDAALHCER